MFLRENKVNLPPACGFSLAPSEFNHKKEVYVLGLSLKNYPEKPTKEKKSFFLQLDGRQFNGKKFKHVINHHLFHPVNTTSLSFKDPQGNVQFVSKFCYISLYLKILENNNKHTVWELKLQLFVFCLCHI